MPTDAFSPARKRRHPCPERGQETPPRLRPAAPGAAGGDRGGRPLDGRHRRGCPPLAARCSPHHPARSRERQRADGGLRRLHRRHRRHLDADGSTCSRRSPRARPSSPPIRPHIGRPPPSRTARASRSSRARRRLHSRWPTRSTGSQPRACRRGWRPSFRPAPRSQTARQARRTLVHTSAVAAGRQPTMRKQLLPSRLP
jgi:hypothetical protein